MRTSAKDKVVKAVMAFAPETVTKVRVTDIGCVSSRSRIKVTDLR